MHFKPQNDSGALRASTPPRIGKIKRMQELFMGQQRCISNRNRNRYRVSKSKYSQLSTESGEQPPVNEYGNDYGGRAANRVL
jgi:hypothetical protein